VPGKTNLAVILLLLFYTSMHAQETQAGQPAQPTSSVYNRMRRVPPAGQTASPQNGTQQARQFPNPAQQFPPEQPVGSPVQGQNFPRQPAPQPAQSQPNNSVYTGLAPAPNAQQPPQQGVSSANPQQPQQPYGLALQPANPPNISYANGELTIVANNSSLADIVSGIERATGVRVEGVAPDSERVFGQFGPGSSRDVLNSLFDGSRYDFILVGSLENPADVRTIILSPHGTAPAAGVSTANNQPYRPPENNEEQEENEQAPVYQGGEGRPVLNVPSEQVRAPQPPPPQPQQPQQAPQSQQQVKTPEQLLQELQRLRQQQQQQQGQQTPH
jgi:hypothetical protein